MDRITREVVFALLEGGAVQLIEALPAEVFAAEHIPGARNVPDELSAAQVAPDRAVTVVVYCSGPYCNRSKVTAAAFARLGYTDVRVCAGGEQDWVEAGLSFEGNRADAITGAAVGQPS